MPMMVVVAVVVTEDPAIVSPTDCRVYISKAVFNNLSVPGLPHLFLEHCPAPRPLQMDRIVDDLLNQRPAGSLSPQNPA
jgi:hypothetical protein